MKIWLDAQLPPALARWIQEQPWDIEAVAVRDIGMRDAKIRRFSPKRAQQVQLS
jgi:predicted nuclease of predicted toxin-antitoxin system